MSGAITHPILARIEKVRRWRGLSMSGDWALELPSCRRRWRVKGESERERERTLLMTFSLSRQRRSSFEVYEVGRLSRSWVSPPGFGGRGLVRAAVINNAAINPGLSPAGMTAFGKKRRENSSPPHLYPPVSFLHYPFRSSLSLHLSLSIFLFRWENEGFEPRVQLRKEDEGVEDEEGG